MNSDITGTPPRPDQVTNSDLAYTVGRPASTYLSPREIVRLTIFRSKLRDLRGDVGPVQLGHAGAQQDADRSASAASTTDQS